MAKHRRQAISQIDGLKTTQLPSPVMAVLTALEMKCTRYKVREDVMDQIVQKAVWNMLLM